MTTKQNQTLEISFKQLFLAILNAVFIAIGLFSIFLVIYQHSEKQEKNPQKELTQRQKDEEQQRLTTAIMFLAA